VLSLVLTRNQVEKVPVQPKTGGLLRLILTVAKESLHNLRDFWPGAFFAPLPIEKEGW
jgi:hypothetical protein